MRAVPAALRGRDAEWSLLARAWAGARRGSGGVVVVDGGPGLGKTFLVRCLNAAVSGATRAWVACSPETQAPLGLAGALLDAVGSPARAGLADGGPAGARLVARALQAAADERPVLAVVDDVQWADEISLDVLDAVAPQLDVAPVLLVATLRTGEPVGGARRRAIAGLLRAARRLVLGPLDAGAARRLVLEAAGGTLDEPVVQAVLRRSQGNPLFLRELSLLAARDPAAVEAPWSLPATVRAVVDGRLDALDAAQAAVLCELALAGDDLPLATAGLALGRDAETILEAVSAGAEVGLVATDDPLRVRFAHPLVRDAVAARLPASRRVQVHRAIFERLERVPAADLALVATHACAAAPAGLAAAAVTWARAAADEAVRRHAHADAARWLGAALNALDLEPAAGDRIELLLQRTEALEASGDRQAAEQAALLAADTARTRDDPIAFARAALVAAGGAGFEVRPAASAHVALLDEALGRLGKSGGALRATLLARRSIAASFLQPIPQRAQAAEEALALARSAGSSSAVCDALAACCDAQAGPDHIAARIDMAGELVRLANASGDRRRELLGLRLLAVASLERGDIAAFDETLDRYEAAAAVLREPLYEWYGPLWRGMRRAMAGDRAGARRWCDEAEAVGMLASSGNAAILVGALRSFLAVDAGDVEAIVDPAAALFGAGLPPPWLAVTLGYLAAGRGELDAARPALDGLAAELDALPVDSEYLPTLAQAARIAHRVGGHPIAASLYERLEPYADVFVVEGIGAYVHGPVSRFLALLAVVLGRKEAAAHAARARAALEQAGARLLLQVFGAEVGQAPARTFGAAASSGTFTREGEAWRICLAGREAIVRDSKGVRDLAVLVAAPRTQVAAVELDGRAPAAASRGMPVLDDRARSEYRRRLRDLDRAIANAEERGDGAALDRALAERDFLVAELASATGLGRRARRMGDDVERARTAVTARIRDAIRRIAAADAAIGEHFRRSVRTGTYCAYDPAGEVAWQVRSHGVRSDLTPSG